MEKISTLSTQRRDECPLPEPSGRMFLLTVCYNATCLWCNSHGLLSNNLKLNSLFPEQKVVGRVDPLDTTITPGWFKLQ